MLNITTVVGQFPRPPIICPTFRSAASAALAWGLPLGYATRVTQTCPAAPINVNAIELQSMKTAYLDILISYIIGLLTY